MTTPSKTAEAVERLNYIAQRLGEDTFTELLRYYPQATSDDRLRAFAYDFRKALQALTDAQQSDARVREALEVLIRHFEGDELHDEGAFDPACADCLALDEARKVLASLTAPKPEHVEQKP